MSSFVPVAGEPEDVQPRREGEKKDSERRKSSARRVTPGRAQRYRLWPAVQLAAHRQSSPVHGPIDEDTEIAVAVLDQTSGKCWSRTRIRQRQADAAPGTGSSAGRPTPS